MGGTTLVLTASIQYNQGQSVPERQTILDSPAEGDEGCSGDVCNSKATATNTVLEYVYY